MNKKLKLILLLLTTVVLIFSMSASAYAYVLLDGYLIGGVANQKFYLGLTNTDLIGFSNYAVADWNYAVDQLTPLNFLYSRVGNTTETSIHFWGEHYPLEEWRGMTYYFKKTSDGIIPIDYGQSRYSYADCVYNTGHLDASYSDPTRAQWRQIAAHEMGHALGLDHTDDRGTLMWPYYNTTTSTAPTYDDVMGVYARYR